MVTFNPELSPHFSGFLFAWDLWSGSLYLAKQHRTFVGASLLANAMFQSIHYCLTLRIREQARSHS